MSPTPPPGSTPAGWYPDTNQPGTLRYWDGTQWTEHTHRQEAGPGSPAPSYPAPSYAAPTYQPGMTTPPNNQLVPAILTTLFCCLPFGIVSIVKAAQVNSQWNTGQYDAARKSAAEAKKWWQVSMIVGLVAVIIYFVFAVALGTMSTPSTGEFNEF